ncbi:MAG: tRNA preQ1(34) S-adenosylmethionine ribosyltransferase-isomerase QueA [Candidatus Cloacimonadota bacterium]|nr:MAG: tRNA preQ1(34) S-adenosylmethionine ribosyltransferase-isomerase QueA [Candidatus Cloacimonadota bacterium]
MSLLKKSSYFYELPEDLIAQHPKDKRSESLLMLLDRKTGEVSHRKFKEIINFLKSDDILVLNKTKVIPARLFGRKITGAQVEIFLLNQVTENSWKCLVRPGKKLKIGTEIIFRQDFKGKIIRHLSEGERIIEFEQKKDFWEILDEIGKVPLPPYIKRDATEKDKKTYQTVYAKEKGSVAAPTAGLHFTDKLLKQIETKGIKILEVILHVGLGTFRPVKVDNIREHKMHSEYCEISPKVAETINTAKQNGRRIIAVGTTTTRTLESFAENGILKSGSHWTDIFIYPGKSLQIIDGLITNFHMPESTLLMLVSAFAGYENIMRAYRIAVEKRYRFFSYGDAMLIL